ncbi:MAG: serine--tRNA ligase, partial [Planctomycetota bacterium]|nr:serine--tRNA ligase [Planctomycetota bacterium]
MLDIKVLRERPEAAKAGAVKKHMPERAGAVDRALAIDADLRAMTPKLDAMRSEQKAGGKQLGKLDAEQREAFLAKQKELKAKLQVLEEEERLLRSQLQEQLSLVPNIPDDEVPDGKDDAENDEVRKVGEIRAFDFTPRP